MVTSITLDAPRSLVVRTTFNTIHKTTTKRGSTTIQYFATSSTLDQNGISTYTSLDKQWNEHCVLHPFGFFSELNRRKLQELQCCSDHTTFSRACRLRAAPPRAPMPNNPPALSHRSRESRCAPSLIAARTRCPCMTSFPSMPSGSASTPFDRQIDSARSSCDLGTKARVHSSSCLLTWLD